MRRSIVSLLLGLALCAHAAGCGPSSGPGAGTDAGARDASAGGGKDGGAASPELTAEWELLTAFIQGGINNGFAITCDDAMVGADFIEIRVESAFGGVVTTAIECPAGKSAGSGAVGLPDAQGPFVLSATLVGKPTSRSERVKGAKASDVPHIRLYALGCDQPACQ